METGKSLLCDLKAQGLRLAGFVAQIKINPLRL